MTSETSIRPIWSQKSQKVSLFINLVPKIVIFNDFSGIFFFTIPALGGGSTLGGGGLVTVHTKKTGK